MHRIFRCWTFAKEDCWSLFVKHALGDTDPDEESNLKRIDKQLNSRRRMEDAGEQYFHELLSRGILFKFKDDSALQNPARVRHLPCIWRLSDTLDKFLAYYGKIKLSRCLRITRLPTDMKDLTKLKHLDLKGTPLSELLDSIGDLKQLGYLDLLGTEIHCISEVKDLSLLRGTFSILRLQHVSQIEHAEMANLKDKYLRELVLEWDAPCNGNTQSAGNNPPNGNMQTVNDLLNRNAENPAVGFSTARPHNGNTHIAEKAMDNPQNWNGKSAEDDLQNLCATHASNVLDKLQPGENLENLEIKNFFGEFIKLVRECFTQRTCHTQADRSKDYSPRILWQWCSGLYVP
ncbi:hypothetical protein Gorai_006435 [Gossypium raimondii]|uniref:R13L1/DRL21-like LRR repeat region domain-containing protein n=1 Tax=Gossypium raimondii TaxID=29730 RepID=A0A7J8QG49_GOSRA|nr:hypothetical protein [Gossypium raimondii]